jgi:opacity protein-like surface antigen
MWGRENSRGPGGIGKARSRGFFVEVNQAFGEKVAGVFRWDDFDPNTNVKGNTRRGWTVGFVYQPHDNLFLRLEYQGHKTGAAPRTRDITLQLQVVY